MDTMDYQKLYNELSSSRIDYLDKLHTGATRRYLSYRKNYPNYNVDQCYSSAVTWAINQRDQERRRKDHLTGAT